VETVNIYDAKTRPPSCVDKAASGEDVVVSRNGKPLVASPRLEASKRRVRFGLLKGKITVPKDFDAPLPDDVLAASKADECGSMLDTHILLWAVSGSPLLMGRGPPSYRIRRRGPMCRRHPSGRSPSRPA
jgi:antitoxin (DNA-binding transcriptional repressor) of toxin-antitoxin stability system